MERQGETGSASRLAKIKVCEMDGKLNISAEGVNGGVKFLLHRFRAE